MEHLDFPIMGKKSKFIRVRADEELKVALKEAADAAERKESDQARYILRVALGLVAAEEAALYKTRFTRAGPSHKRAGSP